MVGEGEVGEEGTCFAEEGVALLRREVVWDEEVPIGVEEGKLRGRYAFDVGGGWWGDAGGRHYCTTVTEVLGGSWEAV